MANFPKSDRLCSKIAIEQLFTVSKSKSSFPLKISWNKIKAEKKPSVKVLIVVSKRNFKHAVDRNLVKRRLREAYRINKGILHAHITTNSINIALFYTGKEALSQSAIEQHVIKLFKFLGAEIDKD